MVVGLSTGGGHQFLAFVLDVAFGLSAVGGDGFDFLSKTSPILNLSTTFFVQGA
jgi:hypothetical protein